MDTSKWLKVVLALLVVAIITFIGMNSADTNDVSFRASPYDVKSVGAEE